MKHSYLWICILNDRRVCLSWIDYWFWNAGIRNDTPLSHLSSVFVGFLVRAAGGSISTPGLKTSSGMDPTCGNSERLSFNKCVRYSSNAGVAWRDGTQLGASCGRLRRQGGGAAVRLEPQSAWNNCGKLAAVSADEIGSRYGGLQNKAEMIGSF